jgi:hypothetical protein
MANEYGNGRSLEEIEPDLLDFIKTRINTFIKWDLARFFSENPYTADTAENISTYAGRNVTSVRPELEELVSGGVMEKRAIGNETIYSLSQNAEMKEMLNNFVIACENREFRVKAVYSIIRGMH